MLHATTTVTGLSWEHLCHIDNEGRWRAVNVAWVDALDVWQLALPRPMIHTVAGPVPPPAHDNFLNTQSNIGLVKLDIDMP